MSIPEDPIFFVICYFPLSYFRFFVWSFFVLFFVLDDSNAACYPRRVNVWPCVKSQYVPLTPTARSVVFSRAKPLHEVPLSRAVGLEGRYQARSQ